MLSVVTGLSWSKTFGRVSAINRHMMRLRLYLDNSVKGIVRVV